MSSRTCPLTWLAAIVLLTPANPSLGGDQTEPRPRAEFVPLFNGRDLSGWYTFLQKHGKNSDPDHVITIEDGAIHLYKHAAEGSTVVMGYIGTEKEYGDYHLRFQYRWGTKKFQPRLRAEAGRRLLLSHPRPRRRLAPGAPVPGPADRRGRPHRPLRLPARHEDRPEDLRQRDPDLSARRPGGQAARAWGARGSPIRGGSRATSRSTAGTRPRSSPGATRRRTSSTVGS